MIDLIVLVALAGRIGLLPSVAIVVITAALGAALVRRGGVATVRRIQQDMGAGKLPTDALLDGACLLVAGAMMLTPGFITDGAALLLLLPPVRALIRMALKRWASANVQMVSMGGGGMGVGGPVDPFAGMGGVGGMGAGFPGAGPTDGPAGGHGDIIEGEVVSRGPARDADSGRNEPPDAGATPEALPERAEPRPEPPE